jgi:hypothetical protein
VEWASARSSATRLIPQAIGVRPLQRAKKIGPADHADELVVPQHRDAAIVGARDERLKLGKRSVLGGDSHTAAHDPPHRGVRQVMADCLVEIFATYAANDAPFVDHEDTALSVALAQHHRVANGVVGGDCARRSGHHVVRATRLSLRVAERGEDNAARFVETLRAMADAACKWPLPPGCREQMRRSVGSVERRRRHGCPSRRAPRERAHP